MREELQSSNEELETVQEELQTANQSLITLNQALQISNERLENAADYTDAIVETVRKPLLVLSQDLHIEHANTSFYQYLQVTPSETEEHALSELGEGQWDIPQLQDLLTKVQDTNQSFRDFEVERVFPGIGHKTMLLNARRIVRVHEQVGNLLLLLAIEDVTERKELERQKDALGAGQSRTQDADCEGKTRAPAPAEAFEIEPIRVRAITSEELVTVCVQDRGSGIPQDKQARIFERFSRADDTQRRHVTGVGLGLSLAAEITRQQGGRIWVESTPGEGSTFCFTMPRNAETGVQEGHKEQSSPVPQNDRR